MDGKICWSVSLPAESTINGLAPASDGRWMLTLHDGSQVIVAGKK